MRGILCMIYGIGKIHLLQVRLGRELVISPRRVRLAQTFCASFRPSEWSWFWVRDYLAQARWARLSELARLFLPSFIELSPRRRGTRLSESLSRLSETPWPERRAWVRVRAGLVFTSLLFYVWNEIEGLLYNGMKGIICMCERVYELWMTNLNKSLAWNKHEMVGCESGMVMRWI